MSLATILFYVLIGIGAAALALIVRGYLTGLKGSPKELWLLIGYNFVETAIYGTILIMVTMWLSSDCGLSDIQAGSYMTGWGIMLSILAMMVGSLVDTAGIKRICLLSIGFLLFSRIAMAFITDPIVVFVLGFLPFALGFAVVGPTVSVGIKRFTTQEGAALGFGLFYIIMNLGFAVGGWFYDFVRTAFSTRDAAGKVIDSNAGVLWLGHHFTTNQLYFVMAVVGTVLSTLIIIPMRDGVERTEDGIKVTPPKRSGSISETISTTARSTLRLMKAVFSERFFWIFLGMIGITVFSRLIFFHFQFTFPKYGTRVFGADAKVGNVYSVLNPVLILFLVPLVAIFTKKVSSYWMLLIGTTISALTCFIAVIPPSVFAPLTNSVLGEMVFVNWLGLAKDMGELAANPPAAEYWPMIFFIATFSIGEAIWSPRLTQYSTEIAPKGKESTYLSLSILPWFVAKLIAGPLSGVFLHFYTPINEKTQEVLPHPHHAMIWFWIGAMALLTPIGLLVFGKWIPRSAPTCENTH